MPARSISTATISFGLVSVPVNLYSSSESKASVSFNMLHKKCGSRLKQQYICAKDNEIVGRDETVKGYEFAKDQYVVLTAEELKSLEEKSTSMIDIIEFIPLAQVQREYLEKVYYLGPDKGGDRAYRLLTEALMATGRAALGQYAARGQQHLVLLRPLQGILVMEQLHYADEVRSTSEVPVPDGEVKPAELALAKMLIEQASSDTFEPTKYRDTVRERVMETIQRKVDGQDITSDVAAEGGGKIIDLMDALKASLARTQEAESSEGEGQTRKESESLVTVRAGTSGYAFKEWKGAFYPKNLKADGMLGYYASKFPTVEINNTFYRLPKEPVVLEWGASVPESFTFAVKASQSITHFSRLSTASFAALERLLRTVRVLGPRLGPVLFQLPSNFHKDLDRLKRFLGELPHDLRFAMEFRHESWFDDEVYTTLRDRNVALVVAEQEEFKGPVVSTASWGYLRLHRFDYDAGSLGEWAKVVAREGWSDAFVFFKHDEGVGSGPPAVDSFVRAMSSAVRENSVPRASQDELGYGNRKTWEGPDRLPRRS